MDTRALERRIAQLERELAEVRRHTTNLPVRFPVGGGRAGRSDFVARVGVATRDGSNFRWNYPFVEIQKTTTGFGAWEDKPGGRSGSMRNLIESENDTAGLFGNGVNSANLVGSLQLQPIPEHTRVRVFTVTNAAGDGEYWCQYENAIDGACT